MAKLRVVKPTKAYSDLFFKCPGCKTAHRIRIAGADPVWEFNGDMEKPTFKPSYLTWWDEGEQRVKFKCHSYITDGKIKFLSDCTHKLAGQTVDLPEWDEW